MFLPLQKLSLKNFRCFDALQLDLDPHLTVLVGPNGGGKTAVLDALAVHWKLFVTTMMSKPGAPGFDPGDVRRVLGPDGTSHLELPTRLAVTGALQDADPLLDGVSQTWTRTLQSAGPGAKTTWKQAETLRAAAHTVVAQLVAHAKGEQAASPVLPVVAYYGTGRLWAVHKMTAKKVPKFIVDPRSRVNAYIDCLSPRSSFRAFEEWFYLLQHEATDAALAQRPSRHAPLERLKSVRRAVDAVVRPSCGWHTLHWDGIQRELAMVHEEHGPLGVGLLSDGIRNLIGLVGDLAHRAVRLNPQFGETAAEETPGMVLIDEIDMHLHPAWQQRVLDDLTRAFPLVQFVVTTHSPQVLSAVDHKRIRVLERRSAEGTVPSPGLQTRGVESATALAEVLGVDPVPPVEEAMQLRSYRALIERGEANEAEAIELRAALEAHFGSAHPLIAQCDRLARFVALRSARAEKGSTR